MAEPERKVQRFGADPPPAGAPDWTALQPRPAPRLAVRQRPALNAPPEPSGDPLRSLLGTSVSSNQSSPQATLLPGLDQQQPEDGAQKHNLLLAFHGGSGCFFSGPFLFLLEMGPQ
ncbi:Hypothetical predicted protein, partial [Marmota monax]